MVPANYSSSARISNDIYRLEIDQNAQKQRFCTYAQSKGGRRLH